MHKSVALSLWILITVIAIFMGSMLFGIVRPLMTSSVMMFAYWIPFGLFIGISYSRLMKDTD